MAYVEETKDKDSILAQLEKESTSLAELSRRDDVKKAISAGDWESLRALSLLPDGFGEARVDAWQFLLNAAPKPKVTGKGEPDSLGDLEPHKDERQVGLDTDRSFVLYPVDGETPKKSKDDLKAQLHHVIVHVLRKWPKLSYFQGYHDILSVLMLTMNEDQERNGPETDEELTEKLNSMAEKLSLHRLRDSMGPGLEPLVGMLRLVKQLLRAVDPEYAKQLCSSSPLPYFALSNLLTYFSHDVPTLPLVQHIFDYLLSRPPIAIIYLTAVLILVRKEEVQALYESGDEGMLHALLCSLPELVDDDASQNRSSTLPVKKEESVPGSDPHSRNLSESWHGAAHSPIDLSVSQTWTTAESVSSQSWTATSSNKDSIPSPGTSPTLLPLTTSSPKDQKSSTITESIPDFPPLEPPSRPSSPPLEDEKPPLPPPSASSNDFKIEITPKPKKQALALTSLLKQADALYFAHPPQTLQLSQIMGPQSVLFTWCETKSLKKSVLSLPQPQPQSVPETKPTPGDLKSAFAEKLDIEVTSRSRAQSLVVSWSTPQPPGGDEISDSTAELMVLQPSLVVRAYKDPDELELEREAEEARENRQRAAEERAKRKKRAKGGPAGIVGSLGGGGKGTVVIVGGVVVVVALGVVIAVYGKNGEWRKWVPRNAWLSRNAL